MDMLTNECCILPISIGNALQMELAKDFMLKYCDEEKAVDLCLEDIGLALQDQGKSLVGYGLPQPISYASEVTQEFDRWHPLTDSLALQCQRAISSFNLEQCMVFSEIVSASGTSS